MIKKYIVEEENYGVSATFLVDDSIATEEKLAEINNYFLDAASMLSAAGGNLLFAVLQRIAACALYIEYAEGIVLRAVIDKFNWGDKSWSGMTEGLPRLDGTDGIRLINIDGIEISADLLTVSEVE